MKRFWKENKILMILGIILLLCLIAILCVVLKYFIGSRNSKYGNRFDNMKVHITEKEQDTYVKSTEENANVEKVSLRVSNKTLYITLTYKDDVKLDDAKKIVEDSLALFTDDVKTTYDINFTIAIGDYRIMGAKNATGNGLLWNNNTPVESN